MRANRNIRKARGDGEGLLPPLLGAADEVSVKMDPYWAGVRASNNLTSPEFKGVVHSCPMPDIQRARALRKKSTWAEKLMWRWLRDRRFSSYKFRRQHPLGGYNPDFFCEEGRVAVELDGSGHGFPLRQVHDAEREKYLGIKTL